MWAEESVEGILSVTHIIDLANELMLIVPGTPLVVGLLLLAWHWAGGSVGERRRNLLEAARSPDVLFALLLAVPIGLFFWTFRPELGMARDWDLFSICGVPMVAITYVLARRIPPGRWEKLVASVIGTLVAATVLSLSWIVVNAIEGVSVARYEAILQYDTTNAGYAYDNLSQHLHDKGDITGEVRALERAVNASPNPRYRFKLGLRYYYLGDKARAIEELRASLVSRPDHGPTRRYLAEMLYYAARYDEMLAVCRDGEKLDPDNAYYPFCVGKAYAALGDWEKAQMAFDRCSALAPSPEVNEAIEEILRRRRGQR